MNAPVPNNQNQSHSIVNWTLLSEEQCQEEIALNTATAIRSFVTLYDVAHKSTMELSP